MPTDMITEFKSENGFGTQFEKDVRDRFFEQIGGQRPLVYAVRYIVEHKGTKWEEIGSRLGINRGQWWRWMQWWKNHEKEETVKTVSDDERKGTNPPSWKWLFSYLTLVRADFSEVFPESVEILYDGIQEMMAYVAGQMRSRRSCAEAAPSPADTPDAVTWHGLIDAFLRIKFAHLRRMDDWTAAVDEVLPAVQRAGRLRAVTGERLRRWVGAWFIPWCLFWDATDSVVDTDQ